MNVLLWVGGLLAGYVALVMVSNLPRMLRIRRLARSRGEVDGFVAFRASLPDVPDDLCRTVYVAIQGLVAKDFPVRADDDLSATLEADQGSVEDLIDELVLNPTDAKREPSPSIVTAADLARAAWRGRNAQQ